MRKQVFGILMAAGVITLALHTPAHAQNPESVKVPFPFVVEGVLLPAGTYRVVPQNIGSFVELMRLDGPAPGMLFLTSPGSTTVPADSDPAMTFKKFGNTYFLAELRMPGLDAREVPLSPRTIAAELARVNAAADRHSNGTR